MSEGTPVNPMIAQSVLLNLPGAGAARVRQDLDLGDSVVVDLYHPPGHKSGERRPFVVMVAGYPDPGFERIVGCRFKEMGPVRSWARLIAASGIAVVSYSAPEPVSGARSLLNLLKDRGGEFDLDSGCVALWASSGNVPLALWLLMQTDLPQASSAAFLYGCTLDLDGHADIANAARQFRFANPSEGKTVSDLPKNTPLFLARAGLDEVPGLNDSMDRFIAAGLKSNLPLTIVNHPDGPHAFDLSQDSATTRRVISQLLEFLKSHLRP